MMSESGLNRDVYMVGASYLVNYYLIYLTSSHYLLSYLLT